jgi:hypothetical protein
LLSWYVTLTLYTLALSSTRDVLGGWCPCFVGAGHRIRLAGACIKETICSNPSNGRKLPDLIYDVLDCLTYGEADRATYAGAYICKTSAVTDVYGAHAAAYVRWTLTEKDIAGTFARVNDRGMFFVLDVPGTLRVADVLGHGRLPNARGSGRLRYFWNSGCLANVCTNGLRNVLRALLLPSSRKESLSAGNRIWVSWTHSYTVIAYPVSRKTRRRWPNLSTPINKLFLV